jgi:outer membrane protein assembly factor BamB
MLRVEGEEVQAVDSRSGRTLWTFNVGGDAFAPVVLDDRRVSVKRADGRVFVLDLRTGKQMEEGGTDAGSDGPNRTRVGR